MQSVRIHAKGDVRVEVIDPPSLEPGAVLLGDGYTGICGSDLHIYFAPEAMAWDFTRPAELNGAMWLQVMGHEFSGRVLAVADDVVDVAVGDNVAIFPVHTCGKCSICRVSDGHSCRVLAMDGLQGRTVGMAEVKIVEAANCFVLPETVDLKLGALVEPMAVAWRGVALSAPEPDMGALVIGGGPIGVGAYFALKAAGVDDVVVSEPSAGRRAILSALEVEHVVDPLSESVIDVCRDLTYGEGVAVAIDCAGAPQAFPDAMQALSYSGRMVIVAAFEKPIELSTRLLIGEKVIRSSEIYTREDFGAVIGAMARGGYRTNGGWIKTVEFGDVERVLRELREGRHMKVLVRTP